MQAGNNNTQFYYAFPDPAARRESAGGRDASVVARDLNVSSSSAEPESELRVMAGDMPQESTAFQPQAGADGPPAVLASELAELRSAVVSPSGLLAATYGSSGSGAYSLSAWDLRSRTRLAQVGLDLPPVAARFTPDESAVVIALRDARVARVVRRPLDALDGPGEVLYEGVRVAGIAMSRDSRIVAMRESSAGITVFDSESRETWPLGNTHFEKVAVSPRGELIVAVAGDQVEIYRHTPGTVARETVVHGGLVRSIDCSAGLVVVATGRTVSAVWAEEGTRIPPVYTAPGQVGRIAMSTGGDLVAVAYDSGLAVVDLATGGVRMEQRTDSPVERLTFRLDDGVLVTAHADNVARFWQLPSGSDYVDWQSDAPAREDLLQRAPLARTLAARLGRLQEDKAPPSFLVHIDGPWGSGKSTLLRLLRDELKHPSGERPKSWLAVDFNAWQQSKVGAPWWSLLAALRHDLARSRALPIRWWLRASEAWVRFRRAGAPFFFACAVLTALAVSFFFLLRPSKMTFASTAGIAQGAGAVTVALGTLWAGSKVAARFLLWDSAQGARLYEQSSANPMLDVSRHFGWLIAKAGRPVVFFIDDLDRCSDGYVVDLLETIQTLVRDPAGGPGRASTAPPSFVVAADGAWIRQSFETAYSHFSTSVAEPGQPLGYLFLDKLFQVRVRVPRVDPVRRELYLKRLLDGALPVTTAIPGAATRDSVSQVLTRLSRSTSEADVVAALRAATPEVRDLVAAAAVERLSAPPLARNTEHWLQQFAALLPPNPRAMKRFINDYSILRTVRTLEGNTISMTSLALWAVIETRWPSLADYLSVHPESISVADPSEDSPQAKDEPGNLPDDLRKLLSSMEFRRLVSFTPGSPLTAGLVAQCCGATEQLRQTENEP